MLRAMEEVWGCGFEEGLNPELEAKMMDHLQVGDSLLRINVFITGRMVMGLVVWGMSWARFALAYTSAIHIPTGSMAWLVHRSSVTAVGHVGVPALHNNTAVA
jgi:hypothetical protein